MNKRSYKSLIKKAEEPADPMILKSDGITITIKGWSRVGSIYIIISGVSTELVNIVKKHFEYLDADDWDKAKPMMLRADELLEPIISKAVLQIADKEVRRIIHNTIMEDATYSEADGNTIEMEVGY